MNVIVKCSGVMRIFPGHDTVGQYPKQPDFYMTYIN